MHLYRRSLWLISYVHHRHGFALIMTLMFIAVLTIVGSTAVTINSTDLLLGGAFQASQTAFHNADAGVLFASSHLSALVEKKRLRLDGTKRTESYTFKNKKPPSFEFKIARRATLKRIANTRKYLLQVRGYASPNSPIKSTIEVVLQRRTALNYGLFAANLLNLPAQGRIYSYDSRRIDTYHTPTTSTGVVVIVSNGVVTAQAGYLDLEIDGDIILGEAPTGEEAHFAFRQASPDVPPPPVEISTGDNHHISLLPGDVLSMDPLDVNEVVETAQKRLRRRNHNRRALGNRSDRITSSVSLKKGNYYLKEITLGSDHSLTLDAMQGDINIYVESISFEDNATFQVMTDRAQGSVNIYLAGPASFNAQSLSNTPAFSVSGDASTFRMFSNSHEPITLNHDGDFKGLIYAPYAPVTVHNTSCSWLRASVEPYTRFLANDAPYTFYTDTALQELFLAKDVEILSWKELRD